MEMMRTMQLELARVARQQHVAAPPAETKEKRGAQQSESLSLQVGAQQQQQQPSPPPATTSPPPAATSPGAARRATVDPPKKLKYAEASVARTLEDWLYEVELYCEQLELASTALWIRQARYVMDRDLWEWWEQYQQQATAKGAPITDWKGFAEALREQFVATGERREAIDELARIQQKSGEDVNAYLLRVAQLHGRTFCGSMVPPGLQEKRLSGAGDSLKLREEARGCAAVFTCEVDSAASVLHTTSGPGAGGTR